MRFKLALIILLLCICVLAFIAILNNRYNIEKLDVSSLTGRIITKPNYNPKTEFNGVRVYDFKSKENNLVLGDFQGYIDNAAFGANNNEIILYEPGKGITIHNIKTSKNVHYPIDEKISFICYISNQNSISYRRGKGIYTYNFSSKKETFIGEFGWRSCWDSSFENIYYCNGDFICKYNLKDKKSYQLFEGFHPEISPNSRYIAYIPNNYANRGKLVVRDIKKGTEWELNTPYMTIFKFSPDNQNIAIWRGSTKFLNKYLPLYDSELFIWNFKNQKGIKLLEDLKFPEDYMDWK